MTHDPLENGNLPANCSEADIERRFGNEPNESPDDCSNEFYFTEDREPWDELAGF